MNERLATLAEQRGFLTRPDFLSAGLADRDIYRLIKYKVLERIGAGLYALRAGYQPLTTEQRHAVRAKAVFHRHRGHVALSHQSAAIVHGLPVWGHPLTEIQVTRLDAGRTRHEAGVQHRVGAIPDEDLMEVDGLLVTRPERCVWELACESSMESALVTADAALHAALATAQDLTDYAEHFMHWPGSHAARQALAMADARSESVGESRSRFAFWKFGVPQPDLQLLIADHNGVVIARTDFGWEWLKHVAEFDGRVKYDGTFKPHGLETMFDEKRREDAIRAAGFGMDRLVWDDLRASNVGPRMERLRATLDRAAQRRTIIA